MATANYIETTRRATRCPYCGNAKIVKNGKQKGKQRYRCKSCAKQFNDSGALHGHRVPAEHIGRAIRDYYGGKSYKEIGESMADAYDIPQPDKAAVYHWVKEYSEIAADAMRDYPAHTSGKWVADEMQVRVGGKPMWNWNVMDAGTRYILTSHLSPNRDQRAAVAVMRKAMAAADTPPRSITTDKLGSYVSAMKQVFPDTEHIQSEGIRAELNNNLSERLQGTFRDREKTLRGLDSLESGQQYLDGWVVQYNLFSDHEGIQDRRPAEMAGVTPPFAEWADIVRNAPEFREGRKANLMPTLAEVADRADRSSPRVLPDSTQRRRPKGETDSDNDEEWPRSDSETGRMERVREQLKRAVRDTKLPPKKAAAILASVNIPGPRRRRSSFDGTVAVVPPKSAARRRKSDDKAATAAKPVLLLGR